MSTPMSTPDIHSASPTPAPALRRLSDVTWAWMQDSDAWGYSNAGLIASQGQALLVDTQFTLGATRQLLTAVEDVCPLDAVGTVVSTHQNGDHTWGNQLLPQAEIITSAAGAAGGCHEMGPDQLTQLCRSPAEGKALAYVVEHFGHFDFSGVTVIPPTRTFEGHEEIKIGGVVVELIDLGAGHSAGDVAVHVPDHRVVFAGDALFSGGHTIVWSGSVSGCVRACQTLLDTGAETFVPGHGTLLDRAGVAAVRDRLQAVADAATSYAQRGMPLADAARLIKTDHAGTWAHPERLFTQTAAAYTEAGIDGVPSGTWAMVEGMAALTP
ncbi:MBL fold metallo-hydrolase [Streptomyces sp. NPDC020883]|uniref:MBL fold metallo-hydrolase n=1 Tax=Streptomyces sp. NPDC020883 TaxID=3365099 RepID=UPI00378CD5CD